MRGAAASFTERLEDPAQRQLIDLLGRRAISQVPSEDLVDWANLALECDYDSPTLRILAARLPPCYWSEVEPELGTALDELGIDFPERDHAIFDYVRLIANRIITREITPREGAGILESVFISSQFSDCLYAGLEGWLYLDEAYGLLEMIVETEDEVNTVVLAEAEHLLNEQTFEQFLQGTDRPLFHTTSVVEPGTSRQEVIRWVVFALIAALVYALTRFMK